MGPVTVRGTCPQCGQDVILVTGGDQEELFETSHRRMLVIVGHPVVDGALRLALGPCQMPPRPLHGPAEEPVVYFAHLKHYCKGG